MFRKIFLFAALLTAALILHAQENSKLKISGYLEIYYGYDFNQPANHNRPDFIYSHHRSDEVNLNLGFIKAGYEDRTLRASLALMAGTYSNANLSAEPGVFKNIYEANVGIKLAKKANLWLDAGIFSSHIGFESAVSKDCWVLTRNISAENTPYFETGAKMTYITNDGRFTASALYLNGWQRIIRQTGNNQPAGGIQLVFKPNNKITLNYSNYIGTERIGEMNLSRLYHNIYSIFQINDQLGLTLGFDYGTQQKSKENHQKNNILAPVVIAQYKLSPKWKIAGRMEYYKDKNNMLIATETPNGFETTGYSLNLDFAPIQNALLRLEGKVYNSKDKIFIRDLSPVNYNAALTASMAISF